MRKNRLSKIIAFVLSFSLIFEQSGFAQVAGQLDVAGHLLGLRNTLLRDTFRPVHLRYLDYDSQRNNFRLLLDKGDAKNLENSFVQDSTRKLMEYFFVGLALPNNSFWVNLRPDSPDNLIDPFLAQTDLGKVLLDADLQLKKDTARMTSPETPEGREYWDKLYKKAEELLGQGNINIPTLTRPWIVPGEIIMRETPTNAYIYKATLKVMLEQDYLKDSAAYKFNDPKLKILNEYASGLVRELIIPKLTRELNTSKRYAPLRQVYYSLILAQWFKQRFKEQSPKGGANLRMDSNNLTDLTSAKPWSQDQYFQQYQKSFKGGEYNIKEPVRTAQGQRIRSYFSGGISFSGVIPRLPGFEKTTGTKRTEIGDFMLLSTGINKEPLLQADKNIIAVQVDAENITITKLPVFNETLQGPVSIRGSAQAQPGISASSPLSRLNKVILPLTFLALFNAPLIFGQANNNIQPPVSNTELTQAQGNLRQDNFKTITPEAIENKVSIKLNGLLKNNNGQVLLSGAAFRDYLGIEESSISPNDLSTFSRLIMVETASLLLEIDPGMQSLIDAAWVNSLVKDIEISRDNNGAYDLTAVFQKASRLAQDKLNEYKQFVSQAMANNPQVSYLNREFPSIRFLDPDNLLADTNVVRLKDVFSRLPPGHIEKIGEILFLPGTNHAVVLSGRIIITLEASADSGNFYKKYIEPMGISKEDLWTFMLLHEIGHRVSKDLLKGQSQTDWLRLAKEAGITDSKIADELFANDYAYLLLKGTAAKWFNHMWFQRDGGLDVSKNAARREVFFSQHIGIAGIVVYPGEDYFKGVMNKLGVKEIKVVTDSLEWEGILKRYNKNADDAGFYGYDSLLVGPALFLRSHPEYSDDALFLREAFAHETVHLLHTAPNVGYGMKRVESDYLALRKSYIENSQNRQAAEQFFASFEAIFNNSLMLSSGEFYAWFYGQWVTGQIGQSGLRSNSGKGQAIEKFVKEFNSTMAAQTQELLTQHYQNLGLIDDGTSYDREAVNKMFRQAENFYFKEGDYAQAAQVWQEALEKAGRHLSEIDITGISIFITKAHFLSGNYEQFIKQSPGIMSRIYTNKYFQNDLATLEAMQLAAKIISGQIKIDQTSAKGFIEKYKYDRLLGPFISGEEYWGDLNYIEAVEALKQWGGFGRMMELINKEQGKLIDQSKAQNGPSASSPVNVKNIRIVDTVSGRKDLETVLGKDFLNSVQNKQAARKDIIAQTKYGPVTLKAIYSPGYNQILIGVDDTYITGTALKISLSAENQLLNSMSVNDPSVLLGGLLENRGAVYLPGLLGTPSESEFSKRISQLRNYLEAPQYLSKARMDKSRQVNVPASYGGPQGIFVTPGYFKAAAIDVPLATTGAATCAALVVVDQQKRQHYLAHVTSEISMEQIVSSLQGLDLENSQVYIMEGILKSETMRHIITVLMDKGIVDKVGFIYPSGDKSGGTGITVYNGKLYLQPQHWISWKISTNKLAGDHAEDRVHGASSPVSMLSSNDIMLWETGDLLRLVRELILYLQPQWDEDRGIERDELSSKLNELYPRVFDLPSVSSENALILLKGVLQQILNRSDLQAKDIVEISRFMSPGQVFTTADKKTAIVYLGFIAKNEDIRYEKIYSSDKKLVVRNDFIAFDFSKEKVFAKPLTLTTQELEAMVARGNLKQLAPVSASSPVPIKVTLSEYLQPVIGHIYKSPHPYFVRGKFQYVKELVNHLRDIGEEFGIAGPVGDSEEDIAKYHKAFLKSMWEFILGSPDFDQAKKELAADKLAELIKEDLDGDSVIPDSFKQKINKDSSMNFWEFVRKNPNFSEEYKELAEANLKELTAKPIDKTAELNGEETFSQLRGTISLLLEAPGTSLETVDKGRKLETGDIISSSNKEITLLYLGEGKFSAQGQTEFQFLALDLQAKAKSILLNLAPNEWEDMAQGMGLKILVQDPFNYTALAVDLTVPSAVPTLFIPQSIQGILSKTNHKFNRDKITGSGIEGYLKKTEKPFTFLETAKLAKEDFPDGYSTLSGLRNPQTTGDIPSRLKEIEITDVILPDVDIFLVNNFYNDWDSIYRLGFLEDGRPVAVRADMSMENASIETRNSHLIGAYADGLKVYRLGFGPEMHGIFRDKDKASGIVMDIVPGDFPYEVPEFINSRTVKEFIDIYLRLAGAGLALDGDFQYFVTPLGDVQAINQGGIIIEADKERRNAQGWKLFIGQLIELVMSAKDNVKEEALRLMASEYPGILQEAEELAKDSIVRNEDALNRAKQTHLSDREVKSLKLAQKNLINLTGIIDKINNQRASSPVDNLSRDNADKLNFTLPLTIDKTTMPQAIAQKIWNYFVESAKREPIIFSPQENLKLEEFDKNDSQSAWLELLSNDKGEKLAVVKLQKVPNGVAIGNIQVFDKDRGHGYGQTLIEKLLEKYGTVYTGTEKYTQEGRDTITYDAIKMLARMEATGKYNIETTNMLTKTVGRNDVLGPNLPFYHRRITVKQLEPKAEFTEKAVTSSPATERREGKKMAGIDFRVLPITRQPASTAGNLNLKALPPANRGDFHPDAEWLQIQKMLDAGIIPSAGRIKEYLQNCCGRDDFDRQIDKVLDSVADILRLEEQEVLPTEPAFKEILVVLESGRSAVQISPMLHNIVALATEPKLIAR